MDIPDNAHFYGDTTLSEYTIDVIVSLRACIPGEGMSDTGSCFPCSFGFYLLEAPIEPTDCIECNAVKAICLGAEKMGPKPGFWRKSNHTSVFLTCPLGAQACLGMLAPNYSPMGECADIYMGVLCTGCIPGYSRQGDFECSEV